jgi:hypothetical protein
MSSVHSPGGTVTERLSATPETVLPSLQVSVQEISLSQEPPPTVTSKLIIGAIGGEDGELSDVADGASSRYGS